MKAILLLAVAVNFHGAATLLAAGVRQIPAAARGEVKNLHFQWFAAGTAAVFGSLYVYLYFYPTFVVPFLIFGAALKTWVLVLFGRGLFSLSDIERPPRAGAILLAQGEA